MVAHVLAAPVCSQSTPHTAPCPRSQPGTAAGAALASAQLLRITGEKPSWRSGSSSSSGGVPVLGSSASGVGRHKELDSTPQACGRLGLLQTPEDPISLS